jgi:hypothetical protein
MKNPTLSSDASSADMATVLQKGSFNLMARPITLQLMMDRTTFTAD